MLAENLQEILSLPLSKQAYHKQASVPVPAAC